MGLSIRAYARHRGVSDTAVHKAIRAGRITPEADGTLDPDKVDREWNKNTEAPVPGTQRRAETCDTAIAEHHKTSMLAAGEWRALAASNGRTAGFHLSSLYSPIGWRSWRDIAAAWESSVNKESGSASAIKTFKNTELGETWIEEGEAPDWQRLLERREDYRIGSIPIGGLLLVGGADVQKDRIEASIWAFGRGKEAWLIEHRVLMGDTARDGVWRQLAQILTETWTHASGARLPLARFALDTGFATQEAYAFVRAAKDHRLMAVKGVPRGAALIGTPTAVDVTQAGKKLRRGIKVYSVAVGIAKLEFYNALRKSAEVDEDGVTVIFPAGFVHLPKVDAEFIQHPIVVLSHMPDEVLDRFLGLKKLATEGLMLHEAASRQFWGLSKLLNGQQEAIALLAGMEECPFPNRPVQLIVQSLTDALDAPILFVENGATFESLATGRMPEALGHILIYASGYKASARRIRSRAGSSLYFSPQVWEGNFGLPGAIMAWLYSSDANRPVYFWGDLDYAGMAILKELRVVFPNAHAWHPGYARLLDCLSSEESHTPEEAAKSGQSDPGHTGCDYADNVLLAAIREKTRFVDQESI